MKAYTATISTALVATMLTSCSYRQSPVECIRFDTNTTATLSSIAERLIAHIPEFTLDSHEESMTRRQSAVGEAWIVARLESVEISLRNHEGKFSDVCAYDHSNGDQIEAAEDAILVVTKFLDELNVPFKRL